MHKALVAPAVTNYGRLDIAFNNAGTLGEAGPSTGVSEAGWTDALAINLTGAFLGAKHQIGADAGAWRRLGDLHLDLRRLQLRLSGRRRLCRQQVRPDRPDPGAGRRIRPSRACASMRSCRAPSIPTCIADMNDTPESQAFVTNLHALKRVATPEELARSVLYLASDDCELRHRHRVAGRWRRFDHPHLIGHGEAGRAWPPSWRSRSQAPSARHRDG